MNGVSSPIDRVFSNLGNLLRYIAPGFVAVLVVWAIKPESFPAILPEPCSDFSQSYAIFFPLILLIAVLIGLTIYALNTGAIVRILWFLIYPFTIWRAFRRQILRNRLRTITPWGVIFGLDSQRLLRRASPEEEVKSIQMEIDKWASMLNFLYCSSYFMIGVPLYFYGFSIFHSPTKGRLIVFVGLFVLVCALISEYRITNREIWAVEKYPDGRPRL
jgi:hypothetical protein